MRCHQATRMISESHERSLDIQEKSWVKSSFSYLPTLSSFSKKLQNLKRDDEAI